MVAIFTGTYRRTVDNKNRLTFPSNFRRMLPKDDQDGLFLIVSAKCTFVWPRSYLERYAQHQGDDPFAAPVFNRAFYSQLVTRSFDATGRIILPEGVGLSDRRVLVVGAGSYVELWRPELFEAEMSTADLRLA